MSVGGISTYSTDFRRLQDTPFPEKIGLVLRFSFSARWRKYVLMAIRMSYDKCQCGRTGVLLAIESVFILDDR
jgi:hypothetical protein